MISPWFMEIGFKSTWTKTHVRSKGILGASYCRWVDLDTADSIRILNRGERPTCKPCQIRIEEMQFMDRMAVLRKVLPNCPRWLVRLMAPKSMRRK